MLWITCTGFASLVCLPTSFVPGTGPRASVRRLPGRPDPHPPCDSRGPLSAYGHLHHQTVAVYWGRDLPARKADVADLNARARELMVAAGAAHGESMSAAGGEFAAGDQVMTLRNSRALG